MYEVKVKKSELLKIIRENREKHHTIFNKAIDGYRQEVVRHLKFALDSALEGKKIITDIKLTEPQDHTAEYDRIIDMLEMSVDEIVAIDGGEHRQFILDEWDWSKIFSSTSSSYSSDSSTNSSDLKKLYH